MGRRQRSSKRGFQSILCAVDFSPCSSAALQTAALIARRSGGHLTALCVEDPLLGAGAAAAGYDTTLLRKSTLDQLRRLMGRVATPAGLPPDAWRVDSIVGKPARAIVAFAKNMAADLIVMGTNGRQGPTKLFFGSVAEAVLRHAPAPLLVVARGRPGRRTRGALTHRPVLGAIELGSDDRADARRMARAAEKIGGTLTLLHVVPSTPASTGVSSQVNAYQRELRSAQKRLQRLGKNVSATSRVGLGRPEEEIAAVASKLKAGMILLALRRGRGIFGPRQGTTTYRVLCASTVPVLALPPNWDR
jgi:nucleotide-binding universal stress UspA family protein